VLTSIFYYKYYRPYMFRTVESSGAVSPRRAPIAQKPEPEPNLSVLLNKSLKMDVISHARQTSTAVNGVKDGARHVASAMENFNQQAYYEGLPGATHNISGRLAAFAGAINQSVSFMSNQQHSQALRDFAEDLSNLVYDSRRELAFVNITTQDGRTLDFLAPSFQEKDQDDLNIAFGESIGVFNRTYKNSANMLNLPLSEHMNFQGLNYFYNYRLGTLVDETFKLIESGLIIDKRL